MPNATRSASHLVGREQENKALLGLLDAPERLPVVAAVVGAAGIGKTTLWLDALEAAKARGYLVLSSRPAETEARFSFAALADLIGGVIAEVLPLLPPPQRRALETALALSESEPAPREGVVAFAFLNTLRQLAAKRPLVLAIDDAQWLDAPSRAMLEFALSRMDTEPIATIVTVRGELPPWLRHVVPPTRLFALELGPLSIGALHALLRGSIGIAVPRPTLVRIWETSGGNPFFAIELARALERRGGRVDPGDEPPMPADLEQLVHARVDSLSAAGMDVARIVAALAEPTLQLVEVAAGKRAEVGLSHAFDEKILELDGDRLRFSHPLLRSAVWARSTPSQRRSLHTRLALLVLGAEERARHLALATSGPNREIASVVEEAAQHVRARGAAASAAELGELALRLTPPGDVDDERRRLLECADSHRAAGDAHRAIALLEQALKTAPPGPARARILIRLARTIAASIETRRAIELFRTALGEAQGDDALEAEIHVSLSGLAQLTKDRGERGLAHAELARQAASRAGDIELRCKAMAGVGFHHFTLGRGIPHVLMEEALALERSLPDYPFPRGPTHTFGYQLTWSRDPRAREHVEGWRRALHAREDPEEQRALFFLALIEWRSGNWELAARYAAEQLGLREQFGLEGAQPVSDWPSAILDAHQGRLDDARSRSLRAIARTQQEGILVSGWGHHWVLGFVELSRGDPGKALGSFERASEIADESSVFEPGQRVELGDTLETLIAVGRMDDAEKRLPVWEERAAALDRACEIAIVARCRGLLFAARGDFTGATAQFHHAVAEHERSHDPFQHARTLLAFGITQRRSKQRAAARTTLEHALTIFERLGAPLWADQARSELRRIGGRAPSRAALTEGERRIAVLVAEGHTNREVAAALFVSEHTVEAALTRAYQKLEVRSRAELAARMRTTENVGARASNL